MDRQYYHRLRCFLLITYEWHFFPNNNFIRNFWIIQNFSIFSLITRNHKCALFILATNTHFLFVCVLDNDRIEFFLCKISYNHLLLHQCLKRKSPCPLQLLMSLDSIFYWVHIYLLTMLKYQKNTFWKSRKKSRACIVVQ